MCFFISLRKKKQLKYHDLFLNCVNMLLSLIGKTLDMAGLFSFCIILLPDITSHLSLPMFALKKSESHFKIQCFILKGICIFQYLCRGKTAVCGLFYISLVCLCREGKDVNKMMVTVLVRSSFLFKKKKIETYMCMRFTMGFLSKWQKYHVYYFSFSKEETV